MSRMVFSLSLTLNSHAFGSVILYWMIHSTLMILRSPVSMVDSSGYSLEEYWVTTPALSVRKPNCSVCTTSVLT